MGNQCLWKIGRFLKDYLDKYLLGINLPVKGRYRFFKIFWNLYCLHPTILPFKHISGRIKSYENYNLWNRDFLQLFKELFTHFLTLMQWYITDSQCVFSNYSIVLWSWSISSQPAHSAPPTADPYIPGAPAHRCHHIIFSACLSWGVCTHPLPHSSHVSCPTMSQLLQQHHCCVTTCGAAVPPACIPSSLEADVPSSCFIISEVSHIPITLQPLLLTPVHCYLT